MTIGCVVGLVQVVCSSLLDGKTDKAAYICSAHMLSLRKLFERSSDLKLPLSVHILSLCTVLRHRFHVWNA